MSRRIADLLIKIGADSYEFQQKAKQVERGLGQLERKLTSIGKELSLKVTAPLLALGAASLHLADVQEKAEAKVQQAIKSTAGAAKLNFEQLKAYASQLQGKTLFGDEKILNDSTAQLLTFTNIAGENFKRTQAVALDLATVLDGDLKSASIQLGKALNDPVNNLSALSRSGIQFSDEQKKVIKSLAETNRLAEAQGVILAELERQYGGQAEAAAKTGLGALQQLKNAWGDFMETIGQTLLPVLNRLVEKLKGAVDWLNNLSPSSRTAIVVIGGLAAAIGPVALSLGGILKMLPLLAAGFSAMLTPIGLTITAVLALAAAYLLAFKNKQDLMSDGKPIDQASLIGLKRELYNTEREHAQRKAGSWNYSTEAERLFDKFRGSKAIDNEFYEKERRLREEIKKREEAIAQITEREKEEQEILERLKKENTTLTGQTKQRGGLINDLTEQIKRLEARKLLPESSVEEIARLNEQIGKLKEELDFLQNVTPLDLERKVLPKMELGSIKPIAVPAFEIKMPDFGAVLKKVHEKMLAIKQSVKENIFHWADETNSHLQSAMVETEQIVAQYSAALVEKGWKFTEALTFVSQKVAEAMKGFDDSLNRFLADSIRATAEAIGQMITGDLGLGGLLTVILQQLANFLKNIGAQLIEFGIMILAFKSALRSVLANPWAAIGIGAAMVAAAAIMTALIQKNAGSKAPKLAQGGLAFGPTYAMVGDNPNAKVDPEVIAPLSKLKGMMTGGGSRQIQIALSGQLTAKGRDLVYVLAKENFKLGVLGG